MSFLWFLEGLRTPLLDKLMQFVTYFGQEIVIITVICILYWCVDKRFAYQLAFTYFTAGLLVQTLKITFRIPRPWILDPDFSAVESAVSGATGYSFPSGHTQGATCLFMPLALRASKFRYKFLFSAAFLLIGFSRMYLGCHTPKDVIVSMAISIFFAWLIWRYQTFFLDDRKYIYLITGALVLVSAFVAVYAYVLHSEQIIEARYAADCFKAAGAGFGFSLGWYLERTYVHFKTKEKTIIVQMFKLFIGLFIALAIKTSLSTFLGNSPLAKMCEYFILVLWVIVIYPYFFNKITPK